jgi:ATP-dependent Lhr-like helicase
LIHTLWGGRINRPLALLLQAAWEEEYGYAVETFADNDTILLLLPNETDEALVEAMLRNPGLGNEIRIHTLLRRKLESSGLFGGRFRENAGRALLLPRAGFKQRMPLWLTRLRSKKLLAAVSGYQDFPIVVETWRTCLNDEFDLPRLADLLAEVQTGRIRIDWTRTTVPSPFTRGLIWQKTNKYMYQGDEPRASGPSQMGQDLLKEVLHSSRLRPRVSPELVRTVEAKLLRTFPGYAPSSADDLVQFVSDRKVVPSDEWSQLVNAIQRDYADNGIIEGTAGRLAWISLPGSREPAVATLDSTPAMWATVTGLSPGPEERRFWDWASDNVQPISASKDEVSRGRLTGALGALSKSTRVSAGPPEESDGEVEDTDETDGRAEADNVTGSPTSADLGLAGLLAGYLAFSGPVLPERLSRIFGVPEARLDGELAALEQNGDIIIDALLKDDESIYVCDAGNLELLLRLTRAEARPEFTPLSLEHLQTYLAGNQGLIRQGSQPQDMEENLERLFGFPLPVELWESDVFPARMSVYYKAWLDSLLANSELIWLGCGEKTLAFVLQEERRLFTEANGDSDLFPQPRGSYSLWDLKETSELTTAQLTERLWHEAWAGRCTTDSFEPLRRGIAGEFASESPDTARGEKSDRDDYSLGSSTGYRGVSQADRGGRRPRGRSRSRSRSWKAARALSGRWIPLASETEEEDLVYQEEENKDRIRQLLDRYGIVFRELLSGELPALRWAALFRTLRLMELSGEVLAGQFFESIRGLQFVRPEGLERLRLGFTTDAVYWMNACDPASLCGRGLSDLPWDLPSRIPSNYLVFRGAELVVVAGRRGRDLTIHTGPDDPRMDEYLGFFRALASRDFEPASWIAVESVNGKPTRDSEYADALVAFGFVRDYKAFHLRPAFARR